MSREKSACGSEPAASLLSNGQRRRVIFNNDGCDVSVPEVADLENPLDFLNLRTTPLVGSHVDTISYCTSIGFGIFKHATKVGSVAPASESQQKYGLLNRLIEMGTDCLSEVVRFGHANGMEVFWSMRMNDTHDGAKLSWTVAANRFKTENPECLMGDVSQKDTFRKWSAVNYEHRKVQDMAVAFVEEVCQGYDVDGVELDFFRHPVFFKETTHGEPVSDSQRDVMSDVVRRIRELTVNIGRQRGRPILLAVRTPDDLAYAASIGLDIERWMSEGWVDMYIPSCYIRLRSWRYSVELGHRYGVAVYPGLSESRLRGHLNHHEWRASDEAYRARAANAWQAGADGIYVFNLFQPTRRLFWEIGDAEGLRRLDKKYFSTYRGCFKVPGGAYPYHDFVKLPTLSPAQPEPIAAGGRRVLDIQLGEDFKSVPADRLPAVTLSLAVGLAGQPKGFPADEATKFAVAFNGRPLSLAPASDGWLNAAVAPLYLIPGMNTVEVRYDGALEDLHLQDLMISVVHA